MSAPTEIPVWVCVGCGRVFPAPRPTKARGTGKDAETRHKVYPVSQPATAQRTPRLGHVVWCGPIEQWVARPA